MRWWAVVGAVLVGGCTEVHAPSSVQITLRDCDDCHHDQYVAAPNHVGMRPTTCADCHRLSDWHGLLPGTHPEDKFSITRGPHASMLCADCHDPDVNPDSTMFPPVGDPDHNTPINVTCIGCHTGAHDMAPMVERHHEVARFTWTPSRRAFCRDCHPLGLNTD